MGAIIIECDECGKETKDFVEIFNEVYCEKCSIEKDLYYLETELKNTIKWLRSTYSPKLKELRLKIAALKNKQKEA